MARLAARLELYRSFCGRGVHFSANRMLAAECYKQRLGASLFL